MTAATRRRDDAVLDVDWERAGRWAGRLASPGPTGTRDELRSTVAELHEAAARARELAVRAGRFDRALDAAGTTGLAAEVLVVDRAGWARAAARSFAALADPFTGRRDADGGPRPSANGRPRPDADGAAGLDADGDPGPDADRAARPDADRDPGPDADRGPGPDADDDPSADGGPGVRGVPATAQAAGLIGFMASRVIGQFDPFGTDRPGGRLLLVAPNVLRTERAVSADPVDFRLWVAVHEQAHALQFAAAPWLADHLRGEVASLITDLSGTTAGQELAGAVSRALRAVRSGSVEEADGLLEVVLEPEHRARLDRITAVMSLLEGHADVTMDQVDRAAVPSARRLRARFDARRRSAHGVDRIVRRLIGLDAKLEQYRRGAAFVRAVRRSAGPDGLDAVWSGPDALPTPHELADAPAWVRRLHG